MRRRRRAPHAGFCIVVGCCGPLEHISDRFLSELCSYWLSVLKRTSRLACAGCALAWLTAHQGAVGGLFLGILHLLTLPLDPLANASCRFFLSSWAVLACPFQKHSCLQDVVLIGLDVVALASLTGAAAEPLLHALSLLHVCKRDSGLVESWHAASVRIFRGSGEAPWLQAWIFPFSILSSATEWFLILDLIWGRIFHTLDPINDPWGLALSVSAVADRSHHRQNPQQKIHQLAVLLHGLDSDASTLALLAHVLVLRGLPAALCDYHADFDKGYMHASQDSVEAYADSCLAQVARVLLHAGDDHRGQATRVILIGHSLGGLVAQRMTEQLLYCNVEVVGVITVCSPLGGVPLLTCLDLDYPTLGNYLRNVRTYAWWDPRRIIGEFIRVEAWIWDEMARRRASAGTHATAATPSSHSCTHVAVAAGRDVIVPAKQATSGAEHEHVLLVKWASHYNLLFSRHVCDALALCALSLLEPACSNKNVK